MVILSQLFIYFYFSGRNSFLKEIGFVLWTKSYVFPFPFYLILIWTIFLSKKLIQIKCFLITTEMQIISV